jgi:putative spermidine/putrescine transport system ATP-binding protein
MTHYIPVSSKGIEWVIHRHRLFLDFCARKESMERRNDFVHLEGLAKRFGSVAAVNNVTISISQGEFLTLLGPSGSGKTTTLMMVAGFEIPDQGEIYINSVPIVSMPPHKRDIGMVFQNYALFPHMTVYENIAFPLRNRKIQKTEIDQRVEYVLDLVKLKGFGGRYPKQLSGGQQQRIALARSLVFGPSVLLMDEPLGALDKKLREYMQLEIKRIQETLQITIIYVTHDQSEALTMSDKVAVMNEGRIEQIGSPIELYENPGNKFVADFIGESNFIEGEIVGLEPEGYRAKGLGGLSFGIHTHKELSLGTKVTLALRPEKLFFIDDNPSSMNQIGGTIGAIVYVGDFTKYEIKVDHLDKILILKQQNRLGAVCAARGEQVRVSWYIQDGKVV